MKMKNSRNRKVQNEKKNECGVEMKQVQEQACCVPVTYCDCSRVLRRDVLLLDKRCKFRNQGRHLRPFSMLRGPMTGPNITLLVDSHC